MSCRKHDSKLRRTCNCIRKAQPQILFEANIKDVSNALAQILLLFGVHECKVHSAKDVIKDCFRHYDKIRHNVEDEPVQGICRGDFIWELGNKCLMTQTEAQFTYTVVKRTFKAFYHGTKNRSLPNPIIEGRIILEQEAWWMHAARRIVTVFKDYQEMGLHNARNYESTTKEIFANLYGKLRQRFEVIDLPECECPDCTKRRRITTDYQLKENRFTPARRRKPTKPCVDVTVIDDKENVIISRLAPKDTLPERIVHKSSNKDLTLPHCYVCDAPLLLCDCNVDPETGFWREDCSQGPYKCFWHRTDNIPHFDPCAKKSHLHQCPVDCDEISFDYDDLDELECICGEDCECFDDDEDESSVMSTEGIEEKSSSESDPNTDLELDPRVVDKYEVCQLSTSSSRITLDWSKCKKIVCSDHPKLAEGEPSVTMLPRVPCHLWHDDRSFSELNLSGDIDCFPHLNLLLRDGGGKGDEEEDYDVFEGVSLSSPSMGSFSSGVYDDTDGEPSVREDGKDDGKQGGEDDADGGGDDGKDGDKDGKKISADEGELDAEGQPKKPLGNVNFLEVPGDGASVRSSGATTIDEKGDLDNKGPSKKLSQRPGKKQPPSKKTGKCGKAGGKKKRLPCCPAKPSKCFKPIKKSSCSECH